jgi:predicted nucleic acid-binding Zn ribbon protein
MLKLLSSPHVPKRRKPSRPDRIADAIARFLKRSGLAERVEQAGVIPEWPTLVGPQIAAVTEPRSITPDGTLFVAVRTNAWMTELSLLEPELLRALNGKEGRARIHRIRWQLMR